MSARRCPVCLTDWPADWRYYGKCPQCREDTDFIQDAEPLSTMEAKSRRLHLEFERYYAQWERDRQRELERLEAELKKVA